MSQFNQQDFGQRYGAMGDEAEGVFEQTHTGKYVRYGLNRPPVSMSMIPPFIRYTPDYLTSFGLVEVQGVGKDRKLKLKLDKAETLNEWHDQFKVTFFVWDTTLKQSTYIEWPDLWDILPSMPIETFPEGKQYWSIDVDEKPWENERRA